MDNRILKRLVIQFFILKTAVSPRKARKTRKKSCGYGYDKVNKIGEAYTESCIGHRGGLARP